VAPGIKEIARQSKDLLLKASVQIALPAVKKIDWIDLGPAMLLHTACIIPKIQGNQVSRQE
jgi:hypothetical protein